MQPPIPPPTPSPKPPPIPLAPGAKPVLPVELHIKPDAVTIAYHDTFWGEWRNGLLLSLFHPVSLLTLMAVAAVMVVIYPAVFLLLKIESFAARWAFNFAFLTLVNGIVNAVQIRQMQSLGHGESVSLRPQELEFHSAVRERHIAWNRLKLIDVAGHLHFVRIDGMISVPHAAFASPESRRLFFEAARTLHKSRGAIWPADLVAQMTPTAR